MREMIARWETTDCKVSIVRERVAMCFDPKKKNQVFNLKKQKNSNFFSLTRLVRLGAAQTHLGSCHILIAYDIYLEIFN